MASSSHYHYHKDNDDDDFESIFDDFFENSDLIPEPTERKNIFLSTETGKKVTTNSGMIVFLKLQHTLTIYSADGFE